MTFEMSSEIGALAKALSEAQSEIETASKSAINPHFNKTYADLASVWEAVREPLTKRGLSVVQLPVTDGELIGVVTMLLHSSGQWIRATLWGKPERPGPQAIVALVTYFRRAGLAAVSGVAPADDDGEEAEGRGRGRNADPPPRQQQAAPAARPPAVHYEVDPTIMARITKLLNELGWAKPHAVNWLKKHFQSDTFATLPADKVALVAEKLEAEAEAALAERERQAAARREAP